MTGEQALALAKRSCRYMAVKATTVGWPQTPPPAPPKQQQLPATSEGPPGSSAPPVISLGASPTEEDGDDLTDDDMSSAEAEVAKASLKPGDKFAPVKKVREEQK